MKSPFEQADDAVERPERGQQGDQGDRPRRVLGAQRAEQGHAAGADEDHEAQELAAELAVAEDDQVGAEEDADHQEEDRPQAVGDGRSAADVADRRVQAEHRREVAEQQVIDRKKTRFSPASLSVQQRRSAERPAGRPSPWSCTGRRRACRR